MKFPATRSLNSWSLAVAFATLCGGVAIGFLVAQWHADWSKTAEALAHFATAAGVAGAGAWALYLIVRRRSLEARAEIRHEYQLWMRGRDTYLRVTLAVVNPSETLLRPGDGMTQVQAPAGPQIDTSDYAYESWQDIATIRHACRYEEVRIEPKEMETFVHDVKLPPGLHYVQIYSWVACQRDAVLFVAGSEDASGNLTLEAHTGGAGEDDDDGRPTGAIALGAAEESWELTTLVDLSKLKASKTTVESHEA